MAKDRLTFSFHLVPGKDDALVEWLTSIPRGNWADDIKNALIHASRSSVSAMSETTTVENLHSEIVEIRQSIDTLVAFVQEDFLGTQVLELREAISLLAQQLEQISDG